MFPRLMKLLSKPADVLARSGPVPWAVKRSFYREAAQDPALHEALAAGLAGSFFNVFGSVDAREAKQLFEQIEVKDRKVRSMLERITSQPSAWRVRAVITVDERDPRWTAWAKKPSFLILLSAPPATPWVPRSVLFHRGRCIGQLMHHSFPFDPKIRHRVHGELDGKGTLFRMGITGTGSTLKKHPIPRGYRPTFESSSASQLLKVGL